MLCRMIAYEVLSSSRVKGILEKLSKSRVGLVTFYDVCALAMNRELCPAPASGEPRSISSPGHSNGIHSEMLWPSGPQHHWSFQRKRNLEAPPYHGPSRSSR